MFTGAGLLTAAFAYELYGVLAVEQATPLQLLFLILSTIAFGWIALGSLNAALGFIPLFGGEKADTIDLPPPGAPLEARTALLFPVYHEDPARIAGTVQAIAQELESMGAATAFDVFILSDTRDEREGAAEESAYRALRHRLKDIVPVYYRRRRENRGRKSGNIKDWVRRFGGGYEHFIILDGDSVMSGTTLVRLALAMQRDQQAGLIQTVPRLTGATTLLQYLTQFASNVYGPLVAAGLAFWHRDQGNYWGHNAIIRTIAFATAAGLPTLPGRAPFGGDILSHDFVEAVLLARADWGVHMVPTVEGSYEGQPPTLPDVVARDRRWAQGNLQHLGIVFSSNITTMGRLHLLMGATSYLMSLVWASSLAGRHRARPAGSADDPELFRRREDAVPRVAGDRPRRGIAAVLRDDAHRSDAEVLRARAGDQADAACARGTRRHARRARRHHRDAVLDPLVTHPDGYADGRRLPGAVRAQLGLAQPDPRRRRHPVYRSGALSPLAHAHRRRHGAGLLRGVGSGSRLDVAGHRRPHPRGPADLAHLASRAARPLRTLLSTRRLGAPRRPSSKALAAPPANGPTTSLSHDRLETSDNVWPREATAQAPRRAPAFSLCGTRRMQSFSLASSK